MKSKSSDWILRISSIGFILFGLLSSYSPSLFWVMPLGACLIQVYLFFRADVYSGCVKGSPRWKTYRFLLFFGIAFLIALYSFVYQNQRIDFSTQPQSTLLIFLFILVFGNYSPKIPFNRNLGIRLPWTLESEETWRYAHRIAGYASFPCALLYLCIAMLGYHNLAGGMILVWIAIPAILSYRYAQKRKETL